MALKQFLALTLALIPASGRAECETEAIKARQMIMASGPFEYSGKFISQNRLSEQQGEWARGYGDEYIDQGNGQTEKKLSGLIEPLRAHNILNKQKAYGLFVHEEIAVGEQMWLRSDTGWFQPITLLQPQQAHISWHELSGYYIVSAKCLGPVEVEGKSLIGYELQYGTRHAYQGAIALRTLREQVFAEHTTGMTVRLEQIYPDEHGVVTFRYDAAIKIEPPKVEANAPEVPVIRFGTSTKF
jgi:hypothetical protein